MAPPSAAAWRALPLVSRGDSRALRIEGEALGVLRAAHARQIHVLGLFGPRQTGKKLFLKTLLHSACDFSASPTESHVLLWLWVPVDGAEVVADGDSEERVKIVLSSGAWADGAASDDRRSGLALLLLLSSAVVYNDDGEVNAKAIERLDWLAEVAQMLRIKANQDDAAVVNEFKQHAPKFIWLAHNFKVKWLQDAETGDKRMPLQYLEHCLKDESGFSEAVMQRNTLRMYFNSYFPARACVPLSRPTDDAAAADPAVAYTLERDALRTQFVESIDAFYASTLSAKHKSSSAASSLLPSKQLMGQELRAEHFVVVLENYVESLNRSNLPTIMAASNALWKRSINDAFDTAERVYQDTTVAVAVAPEAVADHGKPISPLSAQELHVAHYRGVQSARIHLNALRAVVPEQLQKTAFQDHLVMWEQQLQSRLDDMLQQNASRSSELCNERIDKLLPCNLEDMAKDLATKPRETFSDGLTSLLSQYKSDLKMAVDAYKQQASGPNVYDILEHVLLDSVFASIKNWGVIVLRQYQQHVRALMAEKEKLEHDVDDANAKASDSAVSNEDQKRRFDEQIDKATKQLSELRRTLLGALNDKKSELERLTSEMTTMELKHDVRVRNLESDIAWTRSRTAELEKAAVEARSRSENDLQNGVAAEQLLLLSKERSFHDEERQLLTQQKELMDRIVTLEREMAQKKTKHVQQVFVLENAIAKKADELKTEHAEFARQLKAQAKTDTGMLKLAYQKKKFAVVAETEKVNREIEELQAKLALLTSPPVSRTASAGSAPKNYTRSTHDFFNSVSMPLPAIPIFPPSAPTSPTAAAGAEGDPKKVEPLPSARSVSFDTATSAAAKRKDTSNDMCKQS
uniref:Guanylate-binding protein N-terminal domain-containing protein n=1 Tax=Globisporangium ultimum (strain ATCC 200006 / CBS 805.95 / DAOM BR144) TaxID=431595 RepID=K3XA31_GLOUD